MKHLDLFSGIGGFSLAASWVWGEEHEIIAFCEIDKFCQKVLKKHWPNVPIFDDIKELHWFVDENDVKWYNKECEQKNNSKPVSGILNSPVKPTYQEELLKHANTVEQGNLYQKALLTEIGDFAVGDVEKKQCGETKARIQAVGDGCRKKGTLTGREGNALKESGDIKKPKSLNGEEEFSQEINIHAKNAGSNQSNTIISGRTISEDGQTIQREGSTSKTGEHYAKNATTKYTIQRKRIDLLTAGVPCQPASCAGKRRGAADDRWLWGETFRIIREAKPKWVILENVRGILTLEQGVVFENLLLEMESYGYEVQTLVIPACAVNAPHRRDRVWILGRRQAINDSKGGRCGVLYPSYIGKVSRKVNTPSDSDCHAPDTDRFNGDNAGHGASEIPQFKEAEVFGGESFADPFNERLQGSEWLGTYDEGQAAHGSTPERNHAWDEPWLEAATRLCGISHGLFEWIHRNYGGLNGKISKSITGQDMPYLWAYIQQESVWEELRGQYKIHEQTDLFSILWEYFIRTTGQNDLSFESAEAQEAFLRNMWTERKIGCSPQRWEYQKQLSREFADSLPHLSHEIALASQEARRRYSANRVNRLKALGNAIVPQVVYPIMKAIKEIEEVS